MRRYINIILSVLLILSMQSYAVMAEEETVTPNEQTGVMDEAAGEDEAGLEAAVQDQEENEKIYKEIADEYALATALGINCGKDKLNQFILKHDFVSMLLDALNKDRVYTADVRFEDVDPEKPYYNDIMAGVTYGIIDGDEKGFVHPESYLNFNEAMKMSIVALNMQYKEYAHYLGGFPVAYNELADMLGVSKKITPPKGSITYAGAIKIIYNLMNADYYKISIQNNLFKLEKTETNNLEQYHNLVKYAGIITNTPFTLSVQGELAKNVIEIDNTQYTIDISSEFNLDDSLGMSVWYYMHNEDNVIRVLAPKGAKNKKLVVSAQDIVTAEIGSVSYYEEGGDKQRRAGIASDAVFFFNGSKCTEIEAGDLKPEEGQLTLVDNNGDGTYEYVIIESYRQYVAQSSSFGKIVSKYDDWSIVVKDNSEVKIFRDGVEITTDFIGEWDSLKVMQPKNGKGGIIKVSSDEVTGKIEKLTTDEDDHPVAVIDGKEFRIGSVYTKAVESGLPDVKTIDIGYTVVAALDDNGTIIGIKSVKTGAGEFGYLVRVFGGEDDTLPCQFKIFTVSGKMTRFKAADKVKINGKKLNVGGGDYHVFDNILIDANGKTIDQLIKYKTNKKDEVYEIELAVDKTAQGYVTNDEFSLCYQWMQGYDNFPHSTEVKCFGENNKYRVSPNGKAPMIFVPADRNYDEGYYVWDAFSNWWDYRKDVDIKVYDAKRMNPNFDLSNVGAVVGYIRQSDRPSTEHPFSLGSFGNLNKYIVMDVVTAIDDDDEQVYLVDVIPDGGERETVIFDQNAYNIDVSNLFGGAAKRPEDLKEGDMINILFDNEKKVDRRVVGYAVFTNAEWYGDPAKERMYTDNINNPDEIANGRYLITYGELIYSSGEEYIVKTKNKSGDDIYITFLSGTTSGNVYVYDTYSESITLATKNQLVTGARVVCSGSYMLNFGTIIVVND